MEGIYFFGEHVRWNLGWSNPNQAGAFVAMWLPWLWALGAWVAGTRNEEGAGRSWHGLRRDAAATMVLAAELVLWFLLCKTYSRGALVAVGMTGVVLVGWRLFRERRLSGIGVMGVRLVGIGVLLFATGFFSRIDPRFVSQDASAGNRLVLWKGGLQMIAASPWSGWGAGESGSGFVHWFQPLDATEKYAGMVNSYLHVGVEYGLPVLVAVMTGAVGIWMISWRGVGARRSGHGLARDAPATIRMGAGSSWLVFLIANVFSTLWIFGNLWWLAAADGLVILAAGWTMLGMRSFGMMARAFGMAAVLSLLVATGLYAIGKSVRSDVRIAYHPGERVVVTGAGRRDARVIIFPESSVLGEDWGKEVRRLAVSERFRNFEIDAPLGKSANSSIVSDASPQVIVACGNRFPTGISALQEFPDAHLILLHPLGTPVFPDGFKGRMSVILPMLDTRNSGRGWKVACRRMEWELMLSPGVGQDVRLVWPGVLTKGL
jgi:hypothetical protein